MEESSSSTEPEGSSYADPLDANDGGGVVRRVEEIRLLAKGDADAPVDGTMTHEAADADADADTGGGGGGGKTAVHDGNDERDDAGGPAVVAASSASSAVTVTSTATPSRSPTLSPDVAPHPQHRPQIHEATQPPAPPANDVDDDGGGHAPSDEEGGMDESIGEIGANGGESKSEIEGDVSGEEGEGDDGTPSVKQLKGWLADFEREQQKHFAENQMGGAAPARPPAIRASASVRGDMMSCSAPSSPARKVKRFNGGGTSTTTSTPGRLLRKSTSLRVAAGEVQATDDGRAPVQTVSAWLTEGDPFHEKKGSKGNVKKLLSSADGVPLVTKVDVTDRKKWLEGAFQTKGREGGGGSREGSFDCGDSAASDGGERGRISAPISAEHNHPTAAAASGTAPEKARGSVKEAARMFGGSVSDAPRRDRVREMREAMERRNEELVRSADPKNFHKSRWETVSGTTRPSAYKKKITDERGMAPKKSLADLP